MTALQLPSDALGYAPARAARLESEIAMRRALPASFALVSGALLALAFAIRLLPAAVAPVQLADFNHRWIVKLPGSTPTTAQPTVRLSPRSPLGLHVPMPVPEPLTPETAAISPMTPGTGAPTTPSETGNGNPGTGDVTNGDETPLPGAVFLGEQLPERVSCPAPTYPDFAREAGVEGTVTLWALVDLDGTVRDVKVIHSVLLLDDAAVGALHRWRFTPALANGHPVRVWIAVPVRFSLR